MSFYGRAPRGFREPPRRASDIRPGDLQRVRARLEDGCNLEISIARRRRKGPQSKNFVASVYTGCMTKARVGAVTPQQLHDLADEFGYSYTWQRPYGLLRCSRPVSWRWREWEPQHPEPSPRDLSS